MTAIHDTLTPTERQAFEHVRGRHMAADRHARRNVLSGVCWSGMGAEPYAMPTMDAMIAEAREVARSREAYEASPVHQARVQIAELTKAYNRLAVEVEAVRSAYSRSEGEPSLAADKAAERVREIAREILSASHALCFFTSEGVA